MSTLPTKHPHGNGARLALAALLAALAACSSDPVPLPDAGPCASACGAGTVCQGGACVAADGGAGDTGADMVRVDVPEDRPAVMDSGSDAGTVDVGTLDAGVTDVGALDAGTDAGTADAGPSDVGVDALPDGCVSSTAANCCGVACEFGHATAVCSAGSCAIGMCRTGFGDCDREPANGCETSLTSDGMNCGACGAPCAAGRGCVAGACVICTAGQSLCSGTCLATATDPMNCGTCGRQCTSPGAVAGCMAGACTLASCREGFGNCDRDPANGCEVDVSTNSANCGVCGNRCDAANATPACREGRCIMGACTAGYGDCNGNVADGCEVALTTSNANCGMCGRQCPVLQTCRNGACAL